MVLSPEMTSAAQRLIDYKKKSTLGREAIKAGGGQVTTMPMPKGWREQEPYKNAPPKIKTPAKPVKKFKGKYIGPDKYKGVIPKHLQHKYKGKYFGKESYGGRTKLGAAKGLVPNAVTRTIQ